MLTDEDYALKRKYDLFCHELLEEVSMKMRGSFGSLGEKTTEPVPLEIMAEAWHELSLSTQAYYSRRLGELWEQAGGTEEPLTEREIAETKGDIQYHEMVDEGLRGRV